MTKETILNIVRENEAAEITKKNSQRIAAEQKADQLRRWLAIVAE